METKFILLKTVLIHLFQALLKDLDVVLMVLMLVKICVFLVVNLVKHVIDQNLFAQVVNYIKYFKIIHVIIVMINTSDV